MELTSYNPERTALWPSLYRNCADMNIAIELAIRDNFVAQTVGYFVSTAKDDDQRLEIFRATLTKIFDPQALLVKSVAEYVVDIRKAILQDFSDDLKAEIEAEIAADVITLLKLIKKPRETLFSEHEISWCISEIELEANFADDALLRQYGFKGPESIILGLFLMTSRYHHEWVQNKPEQPSEQTYFLASLMSAFLDCSQLWTSSKPPQRSPYAPLFSLKLPIVLEDETLAHGLLHSTRVVYLRMNELPKDTEDLFFASTHLCQFQTPEVHVNHDTRRVQNFAAFSTPTRRLNTEDPRNKKRE